MRIEDIIKAEIQKKVEDTASKPVRPILDGRFGTDHTAYYVTEDGEVYGAAYGVRRALMITKIKIQKDRRYYLVSRNGIKNIKPETAIGLSWGEEYAVEYLRNKKEVKKPRRNRKKNVKPPSDKTLQIEALLKEGVRGTEIAKRLGVTRQYVSQIKLRLTNKKEIG